MTSLKDFAETLQTQFEVMNGSFQLQKEQYELAVKLALEKYRQIKAPEDDDSCLFLDEYASVWIKEYGFALARDMYAMKTFYDSAQSKTLSDRAKEEKEKLESDLKKTMTA